MEELISRTIESNWWASGYVLGYLKNGKRIFHPTKVVKAETKKALIKKLRKMFDEGTLAEETDKKDFAKIKGVHVFLYRVDVCLTDKRRIVASVKKEDFWSKGLTLEEDIDLYIHAGWYSAKLELLPKL